MKVLLTGRGGQLGQALLRTKPASWDVVATSRKELDLSDAAACEQAVYTIRPDWVLNAGAYTAVDKAESEPELAHAINADAPRAFARALNNTGGRLLQVSTDFVFSGNQGKPYTPNAQIEPLGVYGRTKAAGEKAAMNELAAGRLSILRTSWVYGPVGKNFLLTMLRLHDSKAKAGDSLSVVSDQVGCPTSTLTLAEASWAVITRGVDGIHHWCDAGAASWYDFALAIGELGVQHGLLSQSACVKAIPSVAYPTPARRPYYSLLDCVDTRKATGLEGVHWRNALNVVFKLLAQ
jgi:dTDP-4-dehydrorhamnose reductase